MDDIPKCPLLNLQTEAEEVPEDIKRSFNTPATPPKDGSQKQQSQSFSKQSIKQPAEGQRNNPCSPQREALPPPDLQECIQNVLDDDYRMDLLAELAGEYTFNQRPKKPEISPPACPFCLGIIDKSLLSEQLNQSVTCFKSKLLNEFFYSHRICFDDFAGGRSKYRIVLNGELAPVEYVIGDDDVSKQPSQRIGLCKEAFIEIGYYHPASNRPMYETIRKLTLQENQDHCGIGRFRFSDGYLGQSPSLSLPFDTYRLCFRISILDPEELNNKWYTTAVATCKKVRMLPAEQEFTLKISGKKATFRIAARRASVDELVRAAPCGCMVVFEEAEVTLQGLFAEKRKKEVYVAPNHSNYSTYSEAGARNKRKRENYLDLSPEVRSTNNKSMNEYPQAQQTRQERPEPKRPDASESDISFREYQQPAQDKSKSGNSCLSYVSKELNMEEVQQAIRSESLHSYLRTQSGSRGLQKYISKCGQSDIEVIIRVLEPHLSSLFCDSYANFFCKTLCQVCNPKQRIAIISKLQRNIEEISKDKRGTHSVQTLVSMMSTSSEETAMYQMLEKYFISLSRDEQGCHIIKKMLPRLSDAKAVAFLEHITDSLLDLSTHQNGIIVIKELVSRVKAIADKRVQVLSFLERSFEQLIQNAFGNYVIQHVIEIYPLKECDKLLSRILARIAVYSNQKISSNVVEKCIMNTNEEIKNKFIVTLSRDEVIIELMRNKFGNFVLEKALKTSSKSQHKMLMKAMSKNLDGVTSGGLRQKWQDYLYDYEC